MKCVHRFVCEFWNDKHNYKDCEDIDPYRKLHDCPYFTPEVQRGHWKPVMVETENGLERNAKCMACGHIICEEYNSVVSNYYYCPLCGAAMKWSLQYFYCNISLEEWRKKMEEGEGSNEGI